MDMVDSGIEAWRTQWENDKQHGNWGCMGFIMQKPEPPATYDIEMPEDRHQNPILIIWLLRHPFAISKPFSSTPNTLPRPPKY